MKDPYKRLSNEWGSKARKADSRAAKSTLKKPTQEDLADASWAALMVEVKRRMANPPERCERCDIPLFELNRFWDGTSWHCDTCAEETQQ